MRETKQAAASPEARAAMHELMAAFEAFKGANDARLAEIEKKASADALLEEKVARIDAAVAGAQARLDRVVSEGRRPAVEGAVVAAPEVKAAWDAYLRVGQTPSTTSWSPSPRGGGLEVKAGLSSASGSGGLVAPAETERLVERRLMAASPMREIATVRTVASGVFRKPVSTAGLEAGWVAETAARPETDPPELSLLEFPSAELYASPAATQALLDDAFVSLDEWLAGEIGHVLSGAAGAFGADPVDRLIDLIYAPKAKYRSNGRFVMNRRTAGAIRKFKDADDNYVWSPATQPGATSSLLGYPVTEIEEMPDIGANALGIAFGDFRRGYLIVDRAGLSVLRDPYSAKPYVLFYTTKRVGGGVQDFDAVKVMKFAAS